MSETTASLRRKISSAGDLQSVVRTMKALAAASIGQYEKSVSALGDYSRTVELGLSACFRAGESATSMMEKKTDVGAISAVVFGSDQGLVGQFNDVVTDFALKTLAALPGQAQIWAVGERVHAQLTDTGQPPVRLFTVPSSVRTITPLIGQILIEHDAQQDAQKDASGLHLFYNRPTSRASYEPVHQRLLPLDESWRRELAGRPWPTPCLPQVMGGSTSLRALLHEHLFVSLFRACAESLASENASRLAAMERADRNIDELLKDLNASFHRLRQSGMDAELFDVISGFEALAGPWQQAKKEETSIVIQGVIPTGVLFRKEAQP